MENGNRVGVLSSQLRPTPVVGQNSFLFDDAKQYICETCSVQQLSYVALVSSHSQSAASTCILPSALQLSIYIALTQKHG